MSAQNNPEKSKLVRRADIQNAVGPALASTLAGIPNLDLTRAEDQRRVMRAVVRLVAGQALDAGADPRALLNAAVEAIGRELEARGLITAPNENDGDDAVTLQ